MHEKKLGPYVISGLGEIKVKEGLFFIELREDFEGLGGLANLGGTGGSGEASARGLEDESTARPGRTLVTSPSAFLDFFNRIDGLMKQLVEQGVITRVHNA